ncbi:MAG TPA: hypothetical protein PKI14_18450 [Fervidobacterium sp.]|nr:hypothetical protein [Fervidobacterium sp.]
MAAFINFLVNNIFNQVAILIGIVAMIGVLSHICVSMNLPMLKRHLRYFKAILFYSSSNKPLGGDL